MLKNFFSLFAALGIAVILAGCTTVGNGVAMKKEFSGKPVESIEVTGNWQIEVICNADANRCEVVTDENIWSQLEVDYNRNFKVLTRSKVAPTIPLTVRIFTQSSIKELKAKGAPAIRIANNRSADFKLEMNGSSQLDMTDSRIGNADIDLEGNSFCRILQSVTHANVELSGASKLEVVELAVLDAKLEDSALLVIGKGAEAKVRAEDTSSLRIDDLSGMISGKAEDDSRVTVGGKAFTTGLKCVDRAALNRLPDKQ